MELNKKYLNIISNRMGSISADFIKHCIENTTMGMDHYDARDKALAYLEDTYKICRWDLKKLFTGLTSNGEWTSQMDVMNAKGRLYQGVFKWRKGDTCPMCYVVPHYEEEEE
jgi:hypothetical protein